MQCSAMHAMQCNASRLGWVQWCNDAMNAKVEPPKKVRHLGMNQAHFGRANYPGLSALAAGGTRAIGGPALQIRSQWRAQQAGEGLLAVVVRTSATRYAGDAGKRFTAIVVRATTARDGTEPRVRLMNVIVRTAASGGAQRPPIAPAVPAGVSCPGRGIGMDVAGPRHAQRQTDAPTPSQGMTPFAFC